jgi:hypothetical protein
MTLDLKKEKKAAEDYIQILTKTDKSMKGVDIGAIQEVKSSQTTKQQPKPTPKEQLAAYLRSIGQQ